MNVSHFAKNGRLRFSIAAIVFLVTVAYADALDDDINWAFGDSGPPAGDCPTYGACCVLGIEGAQPRSMIAAEAVVAAKAGYCEAAVLKMAETQCHNGEAASRILSSADRVCSILQGR